MANLQAFRVDIRKEFDTLPFKSLTVQARNVRHCMDLVGSAWAGYRITCYPVGTQLKMKMK